ncbi:hypothetical protein ACFL44_00485 [Gemmatimonadota bacterium]
MSHSVINRSYSIPLIAALLVIISGCAGTQEIQPVVDESAGEIEALMNKVSGLEQELVTTRASLGELGTERTRLLGTIEELRGRLAGIEEEKSELEGRLMEERDRSSRTAASAEELEQGLQSLRRQLSVSRDRISELENELSIKGQDVVRLNQTIRAQQDNISSLEGELSSLRNELETVISSKKRTVTLLLGLILLAGIAGSGITLLIKK